MWCDDYHDNYVKPDNKKELEELIAPLILFRKEDKTWKKMHKVIKQCAKIFGYKNISLYHTDYQKYGDHLDTFLAGFWVNLRDAEYNEGSIEFDENTILIEDGFMWVGH